MALERTAAALNPTLTRGAVDLGTLAAMVYTAQNYLPDLSSPTMAVAGAIGTLGLYVVDRFTKKLLKKRKEKGPMTSRAQAAIAAGVMALSGYSLSDEVEDVYNDLEGLVEVDNTRTPANVDLRGARKFARELPVSKDYKLPNFSGVKLAPKNSVKGRIERTYRWKPIIDAVEKKYSIPQGVLAGLVMHESYGDPLQPNSSNDGGIGLVHTQGTTAKSLGLRIYGDSNSAHDPKHGKKLKKMFEDCRYELECVAEHDDRAHPLKNLDAIARYMLRGYKTHGSWNKAIQWVRGPGHVGKKRGLRYLSSVRSKAKAFNTQVKEARKDFNKRNKVEWNTYQGAFHNMSKRNFGLRGYK